jgi:hypothetical protein
MKSIAINILSHCAWKLLANLQFVRTRVNYAIPICKCAMNVKLVIEIRPRKSINKSN